MTAAIIAENFTGAIGTVIFVAYLSALCQSPLHTATQFALLTALSAVGRTYLSSGAGYLAQSTGWPVFFVLSALVALPSFALLAWLQARGHFATIGKPSVVRARRLTEPHPDEEREARLEGWPLTPAVAAILRDAIATHGPLRMRMGV